MGIARTLEKRDIEQQHGCVGRTEEGARGGGSSNPSSVSTDRGLKIVDFYILRIFVD